MKVLFTTDTIQRGGKERQLSILASALQAKGNEVAIMTLRKDTVNYLDEYGINPDRLIAVGKKRFLDKYFESLMIFKSANPDVVFSWDMQTALFALISHRRIGFAFINGCIQHGIRLFKGSHLLRSAICWLSPYVVANSEAGLRANNLKPGNRRLILRNGIEDRFRNRLSKNEIKMKRTALIPQYGKRHGKVLISIANLVPFKDYFTVLKALKELKKSTPFFYLIIGEGPMREDIEKKIAEYELNEDVMLVGRVYGVMDYLHISDCLIHSSRGEGVSNAILEAMFAGLPVIATNVGGIPETVFPESSMLFPYKDHKALYNCLLKLGAMSDSFDPNTISYRQHLEKFSVDSMVAKFEEILSAVMTNKEMVS